MLNDFIYIIIMAIFCEALTELICKAEILEKPREYVRGLNGFFDRLLECPYCTSVWCGFLASLIIMYYNLITNDINGIPWYAVILIWFILSLVIHRTSNALHLLYGYLRDLQIEIRINRSRKGGTDED